MPLNFNSKVSRISGLQSERAAAGICLPSLPSPLFSRDHLETISSVSCAAAEPRKSQSRPLQQLHPFPEKRRRRRRRIGPLDLKQLDFFHQESPSLLKRKEVAKIFPLNYSCHDRHFHFLQRRRRHEVLARIYGRYKVPFFPDRGGGGGGNMCAAVLTFRSGRALRRRFGCWLHKLRPPPFRLE